MAIQSSYKSSHRVNTNFDPISVKHTSLMDGLMKIYGTWKAIPPDLRYKITGSKRDLNQAVAAGSMREDGKRWDAVDRYEEWKDANPNGTYEEYAKWKKANELADADSSALASKGELNKTADDAVTEGAAEEASKGTITETTQEGDEEPKTTTYEWDTSKGLPTDTDLFLGGFGIKPIEEEDFGLAGMEYVGEEDPAEHASRAMEGYRPNDIPPPPREEDYDRHYEVPEDERDDWEDDKWDTVGALNAKEAALEEEEARRKEEEEAADQWGAYHM